MTDEDAQTLELMLTYLHEHGFDGAWLLEQSVGGICELFLNLSSIEIASLEREEETAVTDPARHNHVTRDIKPPGTCPACDQYHERDRER